MTIRADEICSDNNKVLTTAFIFVKIYGPIFLYLSEIASTLVVIINNRNNSLLKHSI